MYITIKNSKGEKNINLDYPIKSLDATREIALVEVFIDAVEYSIKETIKPDKISKLVIPAGIYKSRVLESFLANKIDMKSLNKNPNIIRTNKLINITELNFHIDEIDNTENLLDGRPSQILLTYQISEYKDILKIEPKNLQFKKLINSNFNSLRLKVTDQNDNLIDLDMDIVLYIT